MKTGRDVIIRHRWALRELVRHRAARTSNGRVMMRVSPEHRSGRDGDADPELRKNCGQGGTSSPTSGPRPRSAREHMAQIPLARTTDEMIGRVDKLNFRRRPSISRKDGGTWITGPSLAMCVLPEGKDGHARTQEMAQDHGIDTDQWNGPRYAIVGRMEGHGGMDPRQ